MARKLTVNIEIDGSAIDLFDHLSIEQKLHGHHFFELHCPIEEKEKSLADGSNACGKEIKIEFASVGGSAGPKNFFKGFVTSVRLAKQQGSTNTIVYEGFAPTLMMDDGPHNQSFEKKNLDNIVKDVLGKYNLSGAINPAYTAALPYVTQYRETSFNFLSRLADQYGEWFFYDGGQICFGKAPAPDPIELVFGRELTSFDLSLNVQPTKFKWTAYDPVGHKFPESSASSVKLSGLDSNGKKVATASDSFYSNEPAVDIAAEAPDKDLLDGLVQHERTTRSGDFVVVKATSDHHGLKVGSIVNLKGNIGDVNNIAGESVGYGEYRIIKITHLTDALGAYKNRFEAIPSSLVEPPANHSANNPVCEVQIAEVLENDDPEKLGRVRVQFPWQKANDEKTPWIRATAAAAGDGHGDYFIPEKGDQVLVAFEHNNPDKPYVIGALYHGKAKPKDVYDKDNNKKVILTKSGNKIFFQDKGGDEEITIHSGSNTIKLSKSGISISASADVSITGNNVTIKATKALTMTSENAKLIGSNSTLIDGGGAGSTLECVSGGATLKGAKVDVSATGGDATINGTTVKLNS